jgi:hypothetical protein
LYRHGGPKNRDCLLRQKIEFYLKRYLDEAEKYESGLDHAWLQLVKEFPLNWFQEAQEFITPRDISGEQAIVFENTEQKCEPL